MSTPGPIFDAHFHVIDPRFPLVANQGYTPDPFTVGDYRKATEGLGVTGGAVVAGSFQGHDQAWLLDALARLGPGHAGVTQLRFDPDGAPTDTELDDLHDGGVRALRANLHRGGTLRAVDLDRQARRAWERHGWHLEVYADAADLGDLEAVLAALPLVVVDHFGLAAAGLPTVLTLVEGGARVKATGFGRVDHDIPAALRAIAAASPAALLFGTDLPCTRAARPFAPADVDVLCDALADENLVRAALYSNAAALYG